MSNTIRAVRSITALLASAGVVVGLTGIQTATADTQMTAMEGVNIRSGPSTRNAIVGGLYRGQTVTALTSSNGWTKIRFVGSTAYIATKYLARGRSLPAPSQVNSGRVRVTTSALNLRKGPGLSYPAIMVVGDGARVALTGKTARGYAEVSYGTARGWLSTQYLASSASGLPRASGIRYATADLFVRTTSGSDFKVVTEVKKGTRLAVTGTTQNGRAQIIYGGAARWVTAAYLSNQASSKPSTPALPRVVGTRYATTALDIRSSSTSSARTVAEVPRGTALSITGVTGGGRAQIVFNRTVRWVTARYLSTKRPGTIVSAGIIGSYAVERGLQVNAIKVHRAAMAAWPQVRTYYGVRPDAIPDHPSGLALDLMIPNYTSASGRALGTRIAAWAQANQARLGIEYIIWNQHIWNVRRSGEGWRYMADRGGDSANHKNHVHITVVR